MHIIMNIQWLIIKDDVAMPTIQTSRENYSAVKQMRNVYKSWTVETTLYLRDRRL